MDLLDAGLVIEEQVRTVFLEWCKILVLFRCPVKTCHVLVLHRSTSAEIRDGHTVM